MRKYSRNQEEESQRRTLKEACQEIVENEEFLNRTLYYYDDCDCDSCNAHRAEVRSYEQSIRSHMQARYEPAVQNVGDVIIQTIFR